MNGGCVKNSTKGNGRQQRLHKGKQQQQTTTIPIKTADPIAASTNSNLACNRHRKAHRKHELLRTSVTLNSFLKVEWEKEPGTGKLKTSLSKITDRTLTFSLTLIPNTRIRATSPDRPMHQ